MTVTAPAVSIQQLPGYVQATFTATVSNIGTMGVQDVAVRFLVDGAPVGADRTIDSLPSGESARVTYERWFARQDGPHVVEVTIDPANTIAESNEVEQQQFHFDRRRRGTAGRQLIDSDLRETGLLVFALRVTVLSRKGDHRVA